MTRKILHYYAEGNTAKGFYHFYDSAFEGINRLFILNDGHRTLYSKVIKKVGENLINRGIGIEYLHSSFDHDAVVAVVIPENKAGIADQATYQLLVQNTPGKMQEYVELSVALDSAQRSVDTEGMERLNKAISEKVQAAYNTFATALKAHDDIEDIYITNMDFAEADKLTDELITLFLGEDFLRKESKIKHRFLGAATPIGAVDYIRNLTEDIEKRYFIKGRAGSGKSTMLRKIAAAGEAKGFDVEIYHCGFDPNSLDMVIIPEKQIAIFDSTAPHEYFPDRENDEVIDMYTRCIKPGTDETFAHDIERTTKAYKGKMNEAISYLAEAKALQDELDGYITKTLDFSNLDHIQQRIITEIEQNIVK